MNTNKFPEMKIILVFQKKQKGVSAVYILTNTNFNEDLFMENKESGDFAFLSLGPESPAAAFHCNFS